MNIQTVKKQKCVNCGASDIGYQLAINYCPHCNCPISYDKYCTCNSASIVDCNKCPNREMLDGSKVETVDPFRLMA